MTAAGDYDVDVVVIGGGVNGTGVARDAAMRGLTVALLERNDFAFGASGNSSGMIHGGPRYLIDDPQVTLSSCRDSGYIQAIAPHLLFRIPFIMPVSRKRFDWLWYLLLDGFFEAYDRFQPLKRGKPHLRLGAKELYELEPGLTPNLYGGMTFDEWGIDGVRLCVANAVDAEERGARLLNGCTLESIERDSKGAVRAVHYRERRSGKVAVIRARAVVNATGAWAPVTASLGGVPPRTARVRPGKGIHVVFDRRLSNFGVMTEAIDGRQIFIEPWQNVSIIGTSDDDYYGDLDHVRATSEEVRYLVEGIAQVFPAVRTSRIIGTYAGVRPSLYAYGPNEDKLSRDHRIVDHSEHGADGLYSMIGGKLASYRVFAEEMTDLLAKRFDKRAPCTSHITALPGGDAPADAGALARELGIDEVAARRLVYRHGSRVDRIAERVKRRPSEARRICVCEPVIEAEIRYALRHEHARSVADVARRTRLGFGPCGGMRCGCRAGLIVAAELGLPPAEGARQALAFLKDQARRRVVGLGPDQARQEALGIAQLRSQLGLRDRDDDPEPGPAPSPRRGSGEASEPLAKGQRAQPGPQGAGHV